MADQRTKNNLVMSLAFSFSQNIIQLYLSHYKHSSVSLLNSFSSSYDQMTFALTPPLFYRTPSHMFIMTATS